MGRRPRALAAILLIAALAGCADRPSDTVTLDGTEVRVHVADTDAARSTGLQGYEELEPGEGMLFVFDEVQVRYFTMKDVTFPIDVVFFAEDMTVSAIEPLEPGSTAVVASPGPTPYVLELPQGWAAEQEIGVGSPLDVPEDLAR